MKKIARKKDRQADRQREIEKTEKEAKNNKQIEQTKNTERKIERWMRN